MRTSDVSKSRVPQPLTVVTLEAMTDGWLALCVA